MKKIIFAISLLLITIIAQSQINVLNNGYVGVGTASPSVKFEVQGDARLNGYVGINGPKGGWYPLNVTSYYGQTIMIDPSQSTSAIGASTTKINFWHSNGWNRLYALSFSAVSDSTLKENITSLSSGALQKVLNMRPVSYDFKNEFLPKNNKQTKNIGLLAQELEMIVPEAVSLNETGNIKMIDYNMIIPILIKAIQEQQVSIETLQSEIKKLKSDKSNLKSAQTSEETELEAISDIASLEQNAPNPFNQSADIKYNIPEKSQKATLYIYNMNGVQIESKPITSKGKGKITINASELKPGIYLYTLIIDGKEIDTKRMILTE